MPQDEPGREGLTDEALLAKAASGDRSAFDLIVERHQAAVFRMARASTSTSHEAEDAFQETFISAFRAAGKFRCESSVRTWLLTIARNAAWQLRRSRSRKQAQEVPLVELGLDAGWGEEDPEGLAILTQQKAILARALALLTEDEREVIVLRDLEELPGKDTAAVLGINEATLKSRLHRARLRLAAVIRKGVRDGSLRA